MARSDVDPSSRKRILRTVRDRLLYQSEPAQARRKSPRGASIAAGDGRSPATAPSGLGAAKRPGARSPRKRVRTKGQRLIPMAIAKLIVLALVIVVGVAAIIWLRNLGEAFGINWIGD